MIQQTKLMRKTRLLARDIDPEFKAGKLEEQLGVKVFSKGWITVTKQYYYHSSEVAVILKNSNNNKDSDTALQEQILQRTDLKKKQRFFAVLRHGNLFLYKDDSQNANLVHAISLQNRFITIWPRFDELGKEELPDASLFTKRTCIAIFKNDLVSIDSKNHNVILPHFDPLTSAESNSGDISTNDTTHEYQSQFHSSNQFFLYFDNNMDKEDWYYQLINASKNSNSLSTGLLDPNVSANAAHLKTKDMLQLIQDINSTENQLTTKWLNALLGRLFLSLQQTDTLNKFIHEKICKKLNKIKTPGFLDDLVVEKVDVGDSAPLFTSPELLELSPEGSTKIAIDVQYRGNLTIIIATKASINLGSHFKQREVSLQLSIKIKEFSGPLLFLIKPPPSNRIWYAFRTEPIMDFEIEPIVSSSKLSYNVVTNAIKSKFAEAVKEGGIWEEQDPEAAARARTAAAASDMNNTSAKEHLEALQEGGMKTQITTATNDDVSSSENSTKSRKYFKNSIKKIGRWYKDNVGNSSDTEDMDEIDVQDKKNDDSADERESDNPILTSNPKMISNRRPVPRRPSQPLNTLSPKLEGRKEKDTENFPVPPSASNMNASKMFANKENRKFSVSSNDSQNSLKKW
ncbi:CGH_1_collapsed_G0056900.mRNA.1.CDS.1 [Saccharomyces cerevisiae]|nr:CGH_1_collapsed_G0056900.mRNA.1.CDS.1 [Saccharomyces cerevisiae]